MRIFYQQANSSAGIGHAAAQRKLRIKLLGISQTIQFMPYVFIAPKTGT
jgi:hypothetical protein